jgi:hypothetical protein
MAAAFARGSARKREGVDHHDAIDKLPASGFARRKSSLRM